LDGGGQDFLRAGLLVLALLGFAEAIAVVLDREDIGVLDDAVDERGRTGGAAIGRAT
jgi:hypothetical protein